MKCRIICLMLALAASGALGAYAADQAGDKPKQPAAVSEKPSATGSDTLHQSMMSGMDKMHSMKMSGDTDQDFANMMIVHHQQAIEMSKAEITYGKNAELQNKARQIIAQSEKDIAELKKHATKRL
jgi:uncharacterized protein (DUF305 family)